MIIVGDDTLSRSDSEGIMHYVKQIGEKTNVINNEENWNGINVLH